MYEHTALIKKIETEYSQLFILKIVCKMRIGQGLFIKRKFTKFQHGLY